MPISDTFEQEPQLSVDAPGSQIKKRERPTMRIAVPCGEGDRLMAECITHTEQFGFLKHPLR